MNESTYDKVSTKPVSGGMSPVKAAGIWRWRHKNKKVKGCEDLDGEVICDGEAAMLKKKPPEQDGEVCSIFESPFRIFKVREFKPKFSFIHSLNYFMKEEI